MTSYMRDNVEKFGKYIAIDVMRSSMCNARTICYIAPVVKNKISKMNVVCKGFIVIEINDVYTSTLESLFKMSTPRTKEMVYAIFFDEFMTRFTLDPIVM